MRLSRKDHDTKICCMRLAGTSTYDNETDSLPTRLPLDRGSAFVCVYVCVGLINALTSRYNSLLACLDYPIFARILV